MEFGIGSWRVSIDQIRPDNEALKERYDDVAPFWHAAIRRLGYLRAYRGLFQRLQDSCHLSHLTGASHILDAGIGTGGLSAALLQVRPEVGTVHGSDISAGMLAEASWRLAQMGHRPVLHHQDSRQRISSPPFDLIISAHMLEHLPDPAGGLEILVEQLRPGAPLVIIMTRRGLASSWLHLNWHIRTSSARGLINMMQAAGLWDAHLVRLGGPPWCSWMSTAAIGYKPLVSA